jgi:hypothetical protein
MSVITFLMLNWQLLLSGFVAILGALIVLFSAMAGFFALIPGPHPEDWFQKAGDCCQKFADIISKFSKK